MPIARCLALALLVAALPLGAQEKAEPIDSAHGRIVFSVGGTVADKAGRTHIVLGASTEQRYSCLLQLTADLRRRGDTLVLENWRIPPTDACPAAMGPASGRIPLGVDEGTYDLIIRHLGRADPYRVVVSDDAIRVAPLAPPVVSKLTDTLVWRLPRNSLAVRCGTSEFGAWTCAELFRLITDEPGIVPIEIPTIGRDPFGERAADYGPLHNDPTRYFRAADSTSLARLYRDVQRFYDQYAAGRLGYGVTILYWTGERWYNQRPRDGELR